jgi:hypothetical protein
MVMAKINANTNVLMDGAVKVYRRPNSKKWQTNFQIAGHWIRLSTGKFDLEGAVKLMRTRIRLLAQPKSMRSIIDATQREQRHG